MAGRRCGAGDRAAVQGYVTLLLGVLIAWPVARASAAKPPPCNISAPSVNNCLPSCEIPCKTERCLYKCHYDTISQLIALATTPAGGPSIEAFNQRVAELGFYLDNNVFLRVDPLGAYKGKNTVADYIATFVHPLGLGSTVHVATGAITSYANSGSVAAVTFVLGYTVVGDPTNRVTNLTGIMFNRFSPITQKLMSADWTFIRFPQFQLALVAPQTERINDAASAQMVQAVCGVDAQVCRPLGYSGYTNTSDCVSYMSSIPRIATYGLQGDNQYCRFLHMAYATVVPKLHCPHIGKSGGGACVEQVYGDYYKLFRDNTFVGRPSSN